MSWCMAFNINNFYLYKHLQTSPSLFYTLFTYALDSNTQTPSASYFLKRTLFPSLAPFFYSLEVGDMRK